MNSIEKSLEDMVNLAVNSGVETLKISQVLADNNLRVDIDYCVEDDIFSWIRYKNI